MFGKDGKPPNKQFKEAMPYTQSLLASGSAIGYHAKAAPPTVTMPRLKVWTFLIVPKGEIVTYIHPITLAVAQHAWGHKISFA